MSNNNANPPAKYAWIVVLSASLFFFYEFIQMLMINSLRPELMQTFHLNGGQLGLLSSTYFWANMVFLLPAGILLDRFSVKKIMLITLGICVIGTLLFSQANNFFWANIIRFFTGIGSAFCFLSCIRLAARWLPANRMALASGLIVTMAFTGGAVAQTPMTLLIHWLGWRQAVLIDGLFGVLIFLLIAVLVKDWPKNSGQQQQQVDQSLQSLGFWTSLHRSYFKLHNWLCGIYTNMMNLPIFILGGVWGGGYLTQVHHLNATKASTVNTMILIGALIGCPCSGWLSDRLGRRRQPMMAGAMISLALIAIVLFMPGLSYINLLILYLLLGFVTSTQVISYAFVTEHNPSALTATSVSVISLNAISGGAIFGPLIGSLLDRSWDGTMSNSVPLFSVTDYTQAFVILPMGFVIALLVAWLTKKTGR